MTGHTDDDDLDLTNEEVANDILHRPNLTPGEQDVTDATLAAVAFAVLALDDSVQEQNRILSEILATMKGAHNEPAH